MADFKVKVYVVQAYDEFGRPGGVLATKLTRGAAQSIAKTFAPCKVWFMQADKEPSIILGPVRPPPAAGAATASGESLNL